MAFDIYGGNLRHGHCEVHPHVHEHYPCTLCNLETRKPVQPVDNRLHPDDPLNTFPALADWLQHVGCYGAGQSMEEWGQIVTWCREAASSLQEIIEYSGGADNALLDDYVMERAQSVISKAMKNAE